ncbi:HNH endonuclease [Paenibacillus cremeus]|uniref:HNH endonuclease n=1 Tax=Paenibacillus cremeus TaxID=2163881 RepID=A0A559KD05_9BACL|nr:HNH endonuclease [Paenibacillus cremeus]TVY10005.1 HNH endonuclease [Paenibacillus cremeus]
MEKLKLEIDLVPETSFYNNLRKVVSKETWDKLRKQTYSKYKVTCGICGAENVVLDCHEIWEYDETDLIQKLVGLIAICKPCHLIKHHGYANILAQKGELNLDELVSHFMKVNNCTKKEYESHRKHAFKEWRERSTKQWTIDLGQYEQYVINK